MTQHMLPRLLSAYLVLMLPLLLTMLFVNKSDATPYLTQFPTQNQLVHTNNSITSVCTATGTGVLVVSVQANFCGSSWVVMTTGLGTSTWVYSVQDNDNCMLIRCLASDPTGNNVSDPVSITTEFDAGSTVNGSCSAVCNMVTIKLTRSGTVTFTGYIKPQRGENITIYTQNFSFTFASNSPTTTVGNFLVQYNETVAVDPTGMNRFNADLKGGTLSVQNFNAYAAHLNMTNGTLTSAQDIIVNSPDFSVNFLNLNAPNGSIVFNS